jgi:hypothetical protein
MPASFQGRLAALSWSDEFEDPISGMRAFRDAADHFLKLPRATQQLPHWQAAVEALIVAAEGGAPLLHARVRMLKAMSQQKARLFRRQGFALGQAEAETGHVD